VGGFQGLVDDAGHGDQHHVGPPVPGDGEVVMLAYHPVGQFRDPGLDAPGKLPPRPILYKF